MTSRIRVFTSGLYMMTSGVVNGADGALVIDPGILPREIGAIRWYVEISEKPAKYLLYTHHHWDHILGGQAFPSARRLAHRCLPEAMQADRADDKIRSFDDEYYIDRDSRFEFQPPHELTEDGWTGSLGDVEFRLVHLPGHAIDMMGVYVPAERTLFVSDMLADIELPIIEGDGGSYVQSLRRIDALVASGEVETVVPGHGRVAHGAYAIRARIAEDIAYIDRLQIIVDGKRSAGEESAVDACRSMSYRGKEGWPSMTKIHEANVRAIFGAMTRERARI